MLSILLKVVLRVSQIRGNLACCGSHKPHQFLCPICRSGWVSYAGHCDTLALTREDGGSHALHAYYVFLSV